MGFLVEVRAVNEGTISTTQPCTMVQLEVTSHGVDNIASDTKMITTSLQFMHVCMDVCMKL